MMKRHLNRLKQFLYSDGQGEQVRTKYEHMMKHDGWGVHQNCLITLMGLMRDDMLSARFLELSPTDKDIHIRAYAGIEQVIKFLLNPAAQARNMNAIKNHNRKMGATATGATKGEKT